LQYAVTSAEMKFYDAETISKIGMPSLVLMERAALETVRVLTEEGKAEGKVLVVAGVGNNGGDGLAIGRMLALSGAEVTFLLAGSEDKASSETKSQIEILRNLGFSIQSKLKNREYDIVIDALFGIGLGRPIEGAYRELVEEMEKMRQRGALVCSVDIPSGISADTGKIMGCAVKADVTVTYAFAKRGELLYPGREYTGKLVVRDIGIPHKLTEQLKPETFFYDKRDVPWRMPKRRPDGNKGTFGKVLLISGSLDMCGACILCGSSILRAGAGMVKIISPECNREIIQKSLPEAMLYSYEQFPKEDQLQKSLEWADIIVAGPGLGMGKEAYFLTEYCLLNGKIPMVLDADALNLIGKHKELAELLRRQDGKRIVLTPHPGELVRLLDTDMESYREKRMETVKEAVKRYGCVLASKDAVTVVLGEAQEGVFINTSGNDGMATAGSGDVLAGIIGGLMAQRLPAYEAACLGVYLHGRAGDEAVMENGKYAVTATDIVRYLSRVMK